MMDFLPSDLFYQQSDMNNIFNGEDELSDDDGYSQVGERIGGGGEKKRRLKLEQVKALEKSFELGNKLEPERKLQLAKALGLHPRQIAIWFQNRRARWKTKQLEKDYALLKKQFEALKAHNHSLQSHNTKLHNQLQALKSREPTGTASINPEREAEDSRSHGTEGNSDTIHVSRTPPSTNGIVPSHQFSGKHILSQSLGNPSSIAQLLQGSTETDTIQCPNMYEMVRDDSLICNMLGGIEDRPGLWSWPGQHHFN